MIWEIYFIIIIIRRCVLIISTQTFVWLLIDFYELYMGKKVCVCMSACVLGVARELSLSGGGALARALPVSLVCVCGDSMSYCITSMKANETSDT